LCAALIGCWGCGAQPKTQWQFEGRMPKEIL
jgi:hypothetical protein